MSILAAADAGNLRGELVFAFVCLAVGLAMAAALHRWRRGEHDVAGTGSPERLPRRESAWPLVGVLGAGVLLWILLPVGFFTYRHAQLIAQHGPEARLDVENMSARDMAFLATVPPVAGLVALVVGTGALRHFGGSSVDLGFGFRRFGSGLLWGVLGSLCVVPLMFGFMVFVDLVYRWLQYRHPESHELLRALGETNDRPVEVMLVVGAALIAPLFEELLFRGHLQTLMRRAFANVWTTRQAARGFPVAGPGPAVVYGPTQAPTDLLGPMPPADPLMASPVAVQALPPQPQWAEVAAPKWTVWAAIIVTSALFACVHPRWTWPPIFVLSLCLGYAYERTGNLWVPVVIHAAFNSTSTVVYLYSLSN